MIKALYAEEYPPLLSPLTDHAKKSLGTYMKELYPLEYYAQDENNEPKLIEGIDEH